MKWVYKTVWENTPISSSKLDELGEWGWELCGVIEYARSYYYYFKKLIND